MKTPEASDTYRLLRSDGASALFHRDGFNAEQPEWRSQLREDRQRGKTMVQFPGAALVNVGRLALASRPVMRLAALAMLVAGVTSSLIAAQFGSATITRLENKVTVSEVRGDQVVGSQPATVSKVIGPDNLLLTESNARAELLFADKTVVRVGPNAVFAFEPRSRTLSLEKGSMLLYLPPGRSSVSVKTAAVTAAISGCTILFDENNILALEGSVSFKYNDPTTGQEVSVTLEAGTAHNSAKWTNGTLVTYSANGQDATWFKKRDQLLSWAALPANAEIKIAQQSPWVRSPGQPGSGDQESNNGPAPTNDQDSTDGADLTGEYPTAVSGLNSVSPSFGAGGGSGGQATTRVLADGTIEFLDIAGQVIGVF